MEEPGITKYFKRKLRTSSSGSEKTPSKKNKEDIEEISPTHSADESKIVDEALDMAQDLGRKIDLVLNKLDTLTLTLDARVTKLHNGMMELNLR